MSLAMQIKNYPHWNIYYAFNKKKLHPLNSTDELSKRKKYYG